MTREELITALRHMAPETGSLHCLGCGYEHNCSTHGCAVIRAAVDALCDRQDQPPNPPLTLEELREMDGEPVWVVPAVVGGKIPERYMLVSDFLPENGIFLFMPPGGMTQGYKASTYGKTWLAYRRKPEEGKANG